MGKKPYVIFYGTGGGVRAIIPLGILSQLREERKTHFIHGVDCLAGPSTAALYLGGFNRPNSNNPKEPLRSEEEMLKIYKNICPEIFHLHHLRRHFPGAKFANRHKYDPKILERFVHDLIGDMKLSEGLKSQIVPTKALRGKNIRLSSIKESHPTSDNLGSDIPLYKACMASAMHPACFPCYNLDIEGTNYDCIDGGLFEHPYYLFKEMQRRLPEGTDIHMIIMSTGAEPKHRLSAQQFGNSSVAELFGLRAGMPLADESTNANFQEGMYHLRNELGLNLIEMPFKLENYFSSGKIPTMDNVTPETLAAYQRISKQLFQEKRNAINQISALLEERQFWQPQISVENPFNNPSTLVNSPQEGRWTNLFGFWPRSKTPTSAAETLTLH